MKPFEEVIGNFLKVSDAIKELQAEKDMWKKLYAKKKQDVANNPKVKIMFVEKRIYDDSFFKPTDELVLSFQDAIELVNNGVAVITHIYI